MENSLHTKRIVQAGGRIQFDVPELAEGVHVDFIVVPTGNLPSKNVMGISDFLRSLPPSEITAAEWSQQDKDFDQRLGLC